MNNIIYRFDNHVESQIKALSGLPPAFVKDFVPCVTDNLYAEEITAVLSSNSSLDISAYVPNLLFGVYTSTEIPDMQHYTSLQDIIDQLTQCDEDTIVLPVLFGQQGQLFTALAQSDEYKQYEALSLFVKVSQRSMLWIREMLFPKLVSNMQTRPFDMLSTDARKTQWAVHEKNAEALAMVIPLMKDGFAPPPITI